MLTPLPLKSACAALLLCSPALAGDLIEITVLGSVASNQASGALLAGVNAGDPLLMRFEVDASVFVDGANGTTRGYAINPYSFSVGFPNGVAVELPSPMRSGQTAYFVLRDEDQGQDGFFLSTSPDADLGLPLAEPGLSGPLVIRHSLAYATGTLASLDILDALATYWATGLEDASWSFEDGATSAMSFDYQAVGLTELFDETYCTAGTSAGGCQASIVSAGKASAFLDSGFTLYGTGAEGSRQGLFIFSPNGRQANPWGTSSSYICVTPPLNRSSRMVSSGPVGTCDGIFAQDLNALWCPACPLSAANPGPGGIVQAQLWYRDPLSTSNRFTAFSNALEFQVAP